MLVEWWLFQLQCFTIQHMLQKEHISFASRFANNCPQFMKRQNDW